MVQFSFERLFKPADATRDKFLSRMFGIFSEEIVRTWCNDARSKYRDLGRPTIRRPGETVGCTLDFTFQSKQDGSNFVGELKCELEFQNYRYLALASPSQLDHHKGQAFARFLDVATKPGEYVATVKGQSIQVGGAILVWGSVTGEGRAAAIEQKGFKDVLSLEQIITELQDWHSGDYHHLVHERAAWCQWLFEQLAPGT